MTSNDVENGKPGVYACTALSQQILSAYLERGRRLSKKGSISSDSSGSLFSMYLEITKTGDNMTVERWTKDADVVFIFVSPQIRLYAIACTNRKSIGRFTFCGRRFTPHIVNPGPDTQLTRYLRFLPQEHLPTSC